MKTQSIFILIGFIGISILASQNVIAQTVLTNDDFYVATNPASPISGNGAVGADQVKCKGGDILIQGSYTILKRGNFDVTPEVDVLADRFNTNQQNNTRTYEVTIRNYGEDFVDLKLKAICLDLG